jgi:hypothetical protein
MTWDGPWQSILLQPAHIDTRAARGKIAKNLRRNKMAACRMQRLGLSGGGRAASFITLMKH